MIAFSGLPLFSPEDASRDSRIDLKDVILQVKDFSRSAELPEIFSASVEKVINTFNIVAGLETGIQQTGKTKSTSGADFLNLTYLISSYDFLPPPIKTSKASELSVNLVSISIKPDSPPPRAI